MTASTTLTDRYLAAVQRHVPTAQWPTAAVAVRAAIEEGVAARTAAGVDPQAAERDALVSLGDPDRVAATYSGRPLHLIGPALYLDWVRLVRVLLLVVLPIVATVLAVTQALAGLPLLAILLSTGSTVISVGIGMVFWTTVVFAIIERVRPTDASLSTWTPDDLPAPSTKPEVGIGDLVGGVLALVLLVGGIIWQATASPFVDENGALITFLAPGLWPWWIAYFLLVVLGEVVFATVLYRLRRWTPTMAAVNIALNAAFTVPFVALLVRDEIVNPAFSAEFAGEGLRLLGEQASVSAALGEQAAVWIALGVIALAVGDSVDGLLKALRAARRG